MKMKLIICLLALTAATNASIISSVTAQGGPTTTRVGADTITFDTKLGMPSGTSFVGPSSGVTAQYSWVGNSAVVGAPDISGSYAMPPGGNGPYLTVGSVNLPSSVTITFSSAIRYFGLYMGSPDTYNGIAFFSPAASESFTGAQLGALGGFPTNGDQSEGKFLNFDSAVGFDRIVLTSSQAAFETDNHAFGSAVPEPGTYALMGAGLVALGVLRSRRRQ